MHPILFHLGHIAVPTEGLLVAFGLLAGLELSCLLSPGRGISPDRIWNLGLSSLLTLFLGERMLVIAFNLGDFVAHPVWMLGLAMVRDERYFYGGVVLAFCAGAGYITAWRLPWRPVLDALAPGAGLALGCASLGSLAAGADFGRATTAAWGVIYTSRMAARDSGTPLGIPLVPTALYAALFELALAGFAIWLLLRTREAGTTAALWLCGTGVGTLLLDQLRYRFPEEALVFGAFTPAESLAALALCCAAVLELWPQMSSEAKPL